MIPLNFFIVRIYKIIFKIIKHFVVLPSTSIIEAKTNKQKSTLQNPQPFWSIFQITLQKDVIGENKTKVISVFLC